MVLSKVIPVWLVQHLLSPQTSDIFSSCHDLVSLSSSLFYPAARDEGLKQIISGSQR